MHKTPLILTVPGLNNSGPDHWQTWWEEAREDCRRIDLGHWSLPVRNVWVSRIEQSVTSVDRPVILVGHSLGCHAIAWWATLNGQASAPSPVVGALLVAPPEVDSRFVGVPLRNFAPSPVAPFRFPTTLVASQDDPFAHPRRSRRLAERWQSRFVDIGMKGHVNAESELGLWHEGQALLDELIELSVARDAVRRFPLADARDRRGARPDRDRRSRATP